MRLIDLFARLGGIPLALSSLGHTCVFHARNIDIETNGDIRKIKVGVSLSTVFKGC